MKLQINNKVLYVLLIPAECFLWTLFTGLKVSAATLCFIAAVSVLSVWLMYRKKQEIRDLFVVSRKGGDPSYDWIRLVALCMVITTHFVQYDLQLGIGADHLRSTRFFYVFTLMCNSFFLLLTGALVVSRYHTTISKFYLNKLIPRILIPLAVNLYLIEWRMGSFDPRVPKDYIEVLKTLYVGGSYMPILNFMITMMLVYLAIPFLAKMVQALSFGELTALVILNLISDTVRHFAAVKPYGLFDFAGYLGVAILGAWLVREEAKKCRKAVAALTLLFILILVYWVYVDLDYAAILTHSPAMYIPAAGIFNFIYYRKNLFRKNSVVEFIGKYSYPALFVHMPLMVARTARYGLHCMSARGLGILLAVPFTLVLSLGAGFAIENTAVYLVESLYGAGLRMCRKMIK